MKRFGYLIVCVLLSAMLSSCSSTSGVTSGLSNAEVSQLVESEDFKFVATRAYPLDQTVINVLNHLTPRGQAFRLLDLSQGYGFTMDHNKMDMDIPYFGTRYRADMNPDSNSFKFKSSEVTVTKKIDKKSVTFELKPTDQQNINAMYLQVFPNGRAFLSINANDRQPISYDGYISSVKSAK